ncbi:MAG: AraC family transcriptional regulator [Cytophagales bacterium]|nr:AraC family transcriptional regulator [Cytophagales bacterium]
MNIPSHKLSEVINEQFNKPFYDFVGHYRCELLKEKLKEPKNSSFTILGLAMKAGFNSKSSLNRIFKEQTGLTPSEYKKAHTPS